MYRKKTSTGRRLPRTLWAVFALAVAALLAAPGPARGQTLKDQAITTAVEDELLFDPAVRLNDLDVTTKEGVVTIRGTVDNLLAKERAVSLAETVKGVRSVVSLTQVKPPVLRTDIGIENDVESALIRDPATKSWKIDVDVEDGAVTLQGTVGSWAQKELAAKVAKGVRGVTAIDNQITIEYAKQRSDYQIKKEIRKRLNWDTLVDDALIGIKVVDGKVQLSGTVGSAAERSQAAVDAWVMGVKAVDTDDLEVKRWARNPAMRKNKYVDKPDNRVTQAVKDALYYDPRVLSDKVLVSVNAGVVTLRGQVDSLKAKRAATEAARHTVGVSRVFNRVKVRPEAPSDREVAKAVRNAILWDPWVELAEVTVTMKNGVANLTGKVDTYFEKGRADDVAARTFGVVAVNNRLDVKDHRQALSYNPYVYDDYIYAYDWYDYEPLPTFKSDRQIKTDIKSELFWNPFVNQGDIRVQVDEGVATLKGTVDTWGEWNTALEEAYEGGATWVYNKLAVR